MTLEFVDALCSRIGLGLKLRQRKHLGEPFLLSDHKGKRIDNVSTILRKRKAEEDAEYETAVKEPLAKKIKMTAKQAAAAKAAGAKQRGAIKPDSQLLQIDKFSGFKNTGASIVVTSV